MIDKIILNDKRTAEEITPKPKLCYRAIQIFKKPAWHWHNNRSMKSI